MRAHRLNIDLVNRVVLVQSLVLVRDDGFLVVVVFHWRRIWDPTWPQISRFPF